MNAKRSRRADRGPNIWQIWMIALVCLLGLMELANPPRLLSCRCLFETFLTQEIHPTKGKQRRTAASTAAFTCK